MRKEKRHFRVYHNYKLTVPVIKRPKDRKKHFVFCQNTRERHVKANMIINWIEIKMKWALKQIVNTNFPYNKMTEKIKIVKLKAINKKWIDTTHQHQHNENVLYSILQEKKSTKQSLSLLCQCTTFYAAACNKEAVSIQVFFALCYVTDYCYHHSFVRHQRVVCMHARASCNNFCCCTFPVYCDDND